LMLTFLKMKPRNFDDLKKQFVPHRETNSVYITKIYHIIFLRKMYNGCSIVRMIQNIFFSKHTFAIALWKVKISKYLLWQRNFILNYDGRTGFLCVI
jgi:hypothetical protein